VVYYIESTTEFSDKERYNQSKNSIRKQLNPLFKVTDLVKIELLPRTASNKVMRRKLRNLYEQD